MTTSLRGKNYLFYSLFFSVTIPKEAFFKEPGLITMLTFLK